MMTYGVASFCWIPYSIMIHHSGPQGVSLIAWIQGIKALDGTIGEAFNKIFQLFKKRWKESVLALEKDTL